MSTNETHGAEVQKIADRLSRVPILSHYHPATNWAMVQHRIDKPLCKCDDCRTYLAKLEVLRQAGELR